MCRPSSAEPQFGWRPTHAAEASCFTLSLCCVFNCLQNSPNFIVSVLSCHFLPIQPPIQECGFLYVIVWTTTEACNWREHWQYISILCSIHLLWHTGIDCVYLCCLIVGHVLCVTCDEYVNRLFVIMPTFPEGHHLWTHTPMGRDHTTHAQHTCTREQLKSITQYLTWNICCTCIRTYTSHISLTPDTVCMNENAYSRFRYLLQLPHRTLHAITHMITVLEQWVSHELRIQRCTAWVRLHHSNTEIMWVSAVWRTIRTNFETTVRTAYVYKNTMHYACEHLVNAYHKLAQLASQQSCSRDVPPSTKPYVHIYSTFRRPCSCDPLLKSFIYIRVHTYVY